MVALFDALPHDDCDRDAEGVSVSAGLYSRVKVGLRKACKLFPWTVQAVNRFAASLLSRAVYTSFAIFAEVQTREHRDTQNSFLPNYVIPLTKFEGGEITVHESEPPVRLDVSRGPVQFCARHFRHSTEPFRGRRVVLVLFALQAATKATAEDRDCLHRLGFPLPSDEQLSSMSICASAPLSLDESQHSLLPSATPSASEGCNSLETQGPSKAQPPVVAECLTSSGTISAGAMLLGWDAVPVGQRKFAAAKTPVIALDVSDPAELQALLNFDQTAVVDWWHVHLFLRSCIRSRGAAPASRPLRDADNIFGRAALPASAAAQVLHDNQLCQAVASVLFRAYESKALVSLIPSLRSSFPWPVCQPMLTSSCCPELQAPTRGSWMSRSPQPKGLRLRVLLVGVQPRGLRLRVLLVGVLMTGMLRHLTWQVFTTPWKNTWSLLVHFPVLLTRVTEYRISLGKTSLPCLLKALWPSLRKGCWPFKV